MKEISYHNNDSEGLMHVMAELFQLPVVNNFVRIPPKIGNGFCIAYNLPDGLSVLISDTVFNDGLVMHRNAVANQQYFILQFNEPINVSADSNRASDEMHIYNLQNNAILLISSLMNTKFIIPPKLRLRSIRIIFGNDFLNSCLGSIFRLHWQRQIGRASCRERV